MELTVYWLELAEYKLEDIYLYYLFTANKRVAKKIVLGIVDATIDIEKNPRTGQIEASLKARKQEFRYLIYSHYKIIYWINDSYNRIEIANVFDTRQSPQKINETV